MDEALAGPVGWLKMLHNKGYLWIPYVSGIQVITMDTGWMVLVCSGPIRYRFVELGDGELADAVADELVRRIRPDGLLANAVQIYDKQAQALDGIEAGIRKMAIRYENTVSYVMKYLAKVRPEVAEDPGEILP